jgi:hypothetical protein
MISLYATLALFLLIIEIFFYNLQTLRVDAMSMPRLGRRSRRTSPRRRP